MAVITISRQYGSRGNEIAQLLCDRLDYRYFDKGLMAQLGVEIGLDPTEVVDRPESKHHARSLVDRLFSSVYNPFGDPSQVAVQASLAAQQQMSLQKFQRLILAAHEHGGVVIVGRGSQVVLKDEPDVLHVRVVASNDQRIRRVQELRGISAAEAQNQIAERDKASSDYVKQYYDADWTDPLLYDITINTGKFTSEVAVDMIVKALERLQAHVSPESSGVASSAGLATP